MQGNPDILRRSINSSDAAKIYANKLLWSFNKNSEKQISSFFLFWLHLKVSNQQILHINNTINTLIPCYVKYGRNNWSKQTAERLSFTTS